MVMTDMDLHGAFAHAKLLYDLLVRPAADHHDLARGEKLAFILTLKRRHREPSSTSDTMIKDALMATRARLRRRRNHLIHFLTALTAEKDDRGGRKIILYLYPSEKVANEKTAWLTNLAANNIPSSRVLKLLIRMRTDAYKPWLARAILRSRGGDSSTPPMRIAR